MKFFLDTDEGAEEVTREHFDRFQSLMLFLYGNSYQSTSLVDGEGRMTALRPEHVMIRRAA